MAKNTKKQSPPLEPLDYLIYVVGEQRVMLDFDLARAYGISTKQFNQAFKRNKDRFPKDFAFQLAKKDLDNLKSQVAISNQDLPAYQESSTNRSQIVTGSQKHRDPRYLPWAFTEHGALMAANILKSERATEMSVYIVRAFVKQRELAQVSQSILKRLAEIDSTLLIHDKALRDIYNKLQPLLQPAPLPPKRKIGFKREDE